MIRDGLLNDGLGQRRPLGPESRKRAAGYRFGFTISTIPIRA